MPPPSTLRTLIVGAVLVGLLALETTSPAAVAHTTSPAAVAHDLSPDGHGRAAHPAFVTQPQTQHLFVGEPLRISLSYNGTAILSEFIRLQKWVSGSGSAAVWEDLYPALQVQRGIHVHTFDRGTATIASSGRYRVHSHQFNSQQTPIGYSDEFTISVNQPTSITRQPTDVTATVGETATFSVAFEAGTIPSTVQWERSARGSSSWTNVSGAGSTTLTTPSATLAMDGDRFRATIRSTSSTGATHTSRSSAATLTVVPAVVEPPPTPAVPEFLEHPQDVTVDAGQVAWFFTRVSLPSDHGSAEVRVQFQTSPRGSSTWFAGGPWTTGSGTVHARHAINAGTHDDGRRVRAVAVIGTNFSETWVSDEAVLTVRPPAPAILTQPSCDPVDEGSASTCQVTLTSGPQVDEVRWQSLPPGASWRDVASGTSTTYTTPPTTMAVHGTLYRVIVTGPGGSTTSAATPLTVRMLPPQITEHPQSAAVDEGADATFTAAYGGTTGAVTTQWYATAPGGLNALPVPGATGLTLDLRSVTSDLDGTRYQARFTNAAAPHGVVTTSALLTVRTAPVVTEHPEDQTVALGRPASFTAAARGSDVDWSQQWFSSPDGQTWSPVPGAVGTTLQVPATTADMDQMRYAARFVNHLAPDGVWTDAATLTVLLPPQAHLHVTPQVRLVAGPLPGAETEGSAP